MGADDDDDDEAEDEKLSISLTAEVRMLRKSEHISCR